MSGYTFKRELHGATVWLVGALGDERFRAYKGLVELDGSPFVVVRPTEALDWASNAWVQVDRLRIFPAHRIREITHL